MAQEGYLDTTFGTNGIVTLAETVKPYSICVQQDGKILVAGSITQVAPSVDYFICRFNPDGTLDNSFGTDGKVVVTQGATRLNGIAEMPDGNIVAMGTDFRFIRLNANGVLDTSLGQNGILLINFATSHEYSLRMKLLPNGKILASGFAIYDHYQTNSVTLSAMVKLNSDLSLDTSFSGDGVFTIPLGNMAIDDCDLAGDGSIIASLKRLTGNGPEIQLIKLTENGDVAPSFGENGVATIQFGTTTDALRDIKILDSGKLLLSGTSSTPSNLVLARMHDNAVYDESYGSSGLLTFAGSTAGYYSAFESWELGDGRIVSVVDRKHDDFCDFGLVFTQENGEIDTIEGINGFAMTPLSAQYLKCTTRQPDGRVLVAGYDANGLILVRYNTDATLRSESFNQEPLQFYPNPATESISLPNLPDKTVISLHDISGKKLFESVSNGETVLDLSSLTAGIYFVNTPYGTKKIVKH